MKTINLALLIGSACLTLNTTAQNIGINGSGANAHPSALLDIDAVSTPSLGVLIPRIALQAINLAAPVNAPATSLLVYNTATASTGTNAVSAGYYYWDGAKWVRFAFNSSGSMTEAWTTTGNAGTNPTTNFIGTTDNQSLVFKTNNTEKMRIVSGGNVGIGTTAPAYRLQVTHTDPSISIATYSQFNPLITANLTSNLHGSWSTVQPGSAFNITGNIYGAVNRIQTFATQTGSITGGYGATNDFNNSGTGLINSANGSINYVSNQSTGIITNAQAAHFEVQNLGGGTITNAYGVSIGAVSGTNKWSLYASDATAPSYFAGSVGIGTNTPTAPLHIIGIGSNNNSFIVQNPSTNQKLDVIPSFALTNSSLGGVADNTLITLRSSGPFAGGIAFASGNDEKIRMQATTGNLGIGTSTPAEKLTIENGNVQLGEVLGATGVGRKLYFSNTSNQSDDIYFQRENMSADNSNLQLMLGDNNSGDDKFLIKTTASTTPLLTVVNNGNVGINTTAAPTEKLEVQGSVKIVDGTQGLNKVLTSDATGKATWKQPSGGYRQKYTLQGAQTYPNSTLTLMNFPTVTIPYTGFYLLNFKSFFNVPNTSEYSYYVDIRINGVPYSNDETYTYCSAGNFLNLTDVYTLQANAGDVITLYLNPVVGGVAIDATAATYTRVRFDLLFLGN